MDLTLKNLHKDLKYVPSFDFQKTMVNWTNATQVVFHNVGQASLQEIADWKQYDRNLFTTFAIGLYLDWPYANTQGRLPDFNTLHQAFDTYLYLLPESDVPYYEAVLLQGQNIYFSDYVRDLKIKQASSGATDQSGKRLVYHTDHQVGVEKDGEMKSNGVEGDEMRWNEMNRLNTNRNTYYNINVFISNKAKDLKREWIDSLQIEWKE